MRKQWLVLLITMIASMALWGCGSGGGSGGDAQVTDTSAAQVDAAGDEVVGTPTCIECHETFSWSDEEVAGYLEGAHVVNHAGHYGYDYMAANGCTECHDPFDDSPAMMELLEAELVTVGCENCHGGGGEHFGVGPIPVAKPGIDQCAVCHDNDIHHAYHPEADFIATNFVESKHSTASVRNEAVCAKCHTAEGGRLYKDVTTREQLMASVLPVESDAAITCTTCHDPHNAGGLLLEDVEDHGHIVASAEYATCTTCHMPADAVIATTGEDLDGEDGEDTDWSVTETIYHNDAYYRIIADTHYDDPATTDVIEGYVVDKLSERACRDCHDVHRVEEIRADEDSSSFSNTINDQWARSGHAGTIGAIKLDEAEYWDKTLDMNRTTEQTIAIKEAGPTEDEAAAWIHYDWDADDRQSCQMCHTSTGAMNFLEDPANYDAANNDFSHLDGWEAGVSSSGQNELLYCWGCHSDNSGTLRDPGAVELAYTVDDVNPVIPDMGDSNVCINCHSGRGNMDSLIGAATANPAGEAVTGGTKTHYFAAGATINQSLTRIGYEYAGQDYADKSYFAHNSFGCADCHMSSEDGHTFDVVEKDSEGVITAIKGTNCVSCHDGEHALFVAAEQVGETLPIYDEVSDAAVDTVVTQDMADAAAEELEHEAHGYHDALEALAVALTEAGTTPTDSYPYFDGPATDQGHGGAMHNYSYLHHEPGAYAHNRYYAKRLIFDSLDWLDNKTLDGSITLDPTDDAAAIAWLGGVAETGVIASRP